MRKGQTATCTARVFTAYKEDAGQLSKLIHEVTPKNGGEARNLYRREFGFFGSIKTQTVIVMGQSKLQTGERIDQRGRHDESYEPAYLLTDKHHKVWVVELYSYTDSRYYKPFYVLEEDLKPLTNIE